LENEQIEEMLKKIIASLDKGVHCNAITEEGDEWRIILSKGIHSDRADLSKKMLEDFSQSGKGGQEIRKTLGKVISKLNRLAKKRR